jgi:hypothetical protein
MPAGLQTGTFVFGVAGDVLNERSGGLDERAVPSRHDPEETADAPELRSISGNLFLEQSVGRLDFMCPSNTSLHSGFRLTRS